MVGTHHNKNYLHQCFLLFREVIETKYPSRSFDLPAIERSVKHLRREIPLSYSDLAQFESPKHWWFEKFWVFPPEDQISPGFKAPEVQLLGFADKGNRGHHVTL